MRPKTYLMTFCLFILHVDVKSCTTSSSKPAAAKFQAETNNGIWWPAEEDISTNSGSNHRHHYSQEQEHQNEHQKHSYKLPETSNETGMNGHGSSSGSKRTNNNSDNNEEQPQITASREPHQSESYYRAEETMSGSGSESSSGSGTSDGSSKDLIESSIISSVPQPNLHNHQQKQSSNSRRLLAKSAQGLGLVHFTNKSITCNDGTPAGYYIKKSSLKENDDNLWIIFLEGGWYCFDQRSCMTRWHRLKHLMSSDGWPRVRHVGGILSPDPTENPYWWNANHVFVPYCSSDTWSGRVRGNENGNPFSFMGALIIDEVIKSLINVEGLNPDASVILAGSSAGGTGAMINVDHVESLLTQKFGSPHSGIQRVKGITDSGWFIDKVPLYTEKANCNDVILCPPEISLREGMNLWNARLPQSCLDSHPEDPWSCFFGYRIYPTLKASLFVFQWLFDEAQMVINNVPTPALKKEEWDYVYRIGDELKKTLMNVTNVFIPSCLAHTVLTHRDWRRVEVNSIELTRALKCWESGGTIEESNFIPKGKSSQKYWEDSEQDSSLYSGGPKGVFRHGKVYSSTTVPSAIGTDRSSQNSSNRNSTVNSNDSSRKNRRRHNRHRHNNSNSHNHRQNRRRRKKLEKRQKLQEHKESSSINSRNRSTSTKKKEQRQRSVDKLQESLVSAKIGEQSQSTVISFDSGSNPETTSLEHKNVHNRNHHHSSKNKNKQKKRKRNRRWYSVCDKISSRLIEKCSWPQCGRTCPKLLNPLTGEEVDFKDLLKSFGLDLGTMAKALGIDLATLNSMDHQVLLQMLTQHA